MRWGKRPSSFILGTDANGKWNKWDILVAEAYEIVQRERCGQCGLPRWMCHSDDPDIQFRIAKDSCSAIQRKERYEDQHKKDKAQPGTILRPEPKMIDDSDPIRLREPYYRALAERNAAPEDTVLAS